MGSAKEMLESEIKKDVGISPALAGAAAYEGLPILAGPLLDAFPSEVTRAVMSGKDITSRPGTPLKHIAEFTRDEVKAIQSFARESGVKAPIVSAPIGGGAFVDPTTPLSRIKQQLLRWAGEGKIVDQLPDRPFIVMGRSTVPGAMHEIGHAKPIFGSTKLRQAVHDVGGAMQRGSPAGGLTRAAIAANVLAPPTEDTGRTRRFLYDKAPFLVGATMTPELLEEARASVHAMRGARRHGPGALRALRDLAPAFGTYAAGAAVPVLATIIAKRLVKALHARAAEQEKTGAEVKPSGQLKNSVSASKWLGTSYAKPRSISPTTRPESRAKETPRPRLPNNGPYLNEASEALNNPHKGFRITLQG